MIEEIFSDVEVAVCNRESHRGSLVGGAGLVHIRSPFSQRLYRGGVPHGLPLATIGPFIAYELAALALVRWRGAHDRDFPWFARLLNAVIETSLPGTIVYALCQGMDPQLVFGAFLGIRQG